MAMDRLNAATVFVSLAFALSGLVALSGLTDTFSVAEGLLFLGTGVVVFVVSLVRTLRATESSVR